MSGVTIVFRLIWLSEERTVAATRAKYRAARRRLLIHRQTTDTGKAWASHSPVCRSCNKNVGILTNSELVNKCPKSMNLVKMNYKRRWSLTERTCSEIIIWYNTNKYYRLYFVEIKAKVWEYRLRWGNGVILRHIRW